jgi:hypothetical protein
MSSNEIRTVQWEKAGDGLLRATIFVCGCPMHLEAHEVAWRLDGGQITRVRPIPAEQVKIGEDSQFEDLHTAFVLDGPQQTITVDGRLYVLFACAQGE